MKIVINTCFGGFGLSMKGLKRLAELQGRPCYFFKTEYARGGMFSERKYIAADNTENKDMFVTAFDIPNPNEVIGQDGNKIWSKHHIDSMGDDRKNPHLVQVVEELGDESNGQCAQLKVIEIPDGVDWEIDEYNGLESVHEKHRSWS